MKEKTINGVDINKLEETIEAIKDKPYLADSNSGSPTAGRAVASTGPR